MSSPNTPSPITKFQISVPDTEIVALHSRLDSHRWPAPSWQRVDDWSYGVPEPYLRELVTYWRETFDWRKAEGRLNALSHYRAKVHGLEVHFIHARSTHKAAKPLLLVHGWPGSVMEFIEVIPRLTQPELYGGRTEDAYHVVCPSLPGYAWSEAQQTPGMAPHRVAAQHAELMSMLGYKQFIAQGGDWGALCCRYLPDICEDRLDGLHLNLTLPVAPQGIEGADSLLTDDERDDLVVWNQRDWEMSGYSHLHGTKPQTIAYGLSDSPIGLAAWITEKFHSWTDNDIDIRDAVSWDDLLTNISIYWFTNSIGSSIRLYKEYFTALSQGHHPDGRCDVPTGIAHYPAEHWIQPASWAKREYNIVHEFEANKGGHFAALERPDEFAADLRNFLQSLAVHRK
jgi:microsomal epoxide hydrolase